jgi:GNAT-family acetyltransferase (TIGR03103 family)
MTRSPAHSGGPQTEAAPRTRSSDARYDPSSRLILREARRRGLAVEVLDARAEYFRIGDGNRSILCRESLSELTTAVALSICDDKRTTARVLRAAGLRVPEQIEASGQASNEAFLRKHTLLAVKPARGEQGRGVSVGIRHPDALAQAIHHAREVGSPVLLEQAVTGHDLRLVVIGDRVVAAAVRRPPRVIGTGEHSVRELIAGESSRRAAATAGESKIPLDIETLRCVREAGYELDDVPASGVEIVVRKAANVHLGGTIEDVTAHFSPRLADVACRAARALGIGVVGLDFIVPDVHGEEYWIIEANERPGLANHEPQPTAERFVDFLFPHTAGKASPS